MNQSSTGSMSNTTIDELAPPATTTLSPADTMVPLVVPLRAGAPRSSTSAHTIQIMMVLGYAVMCFLCFTLVAYLRRNRSDARKGNGSAARKIILPAFEPLLWILGATTGMFTAALFLFLVLDVFEHGQPKIATECFYCGRQFVFLLVMVFMHQKSVSLPALWRCVVISFVLATYTLPFVIYVSYWGDATQANLYYLIQRVLRLLLVAWYVFIFVRPPSRASRKSIREFCVFTFAYQAFSITSSELIHIGYIDTGFILVYCALLWAGLCPLVMWRVLRADTEHWRGMGQRACALQSVFRQRHLINEHISSQGLHVLIEIHRKLIIDFAYLDLRSKIGVGASAIVFNGVLHSRTPVAAKVYTPLTLTDEVVASFSQEAALCGALHHPNVVTFYGMCVCPPTICLVFELCQGSLEAVLRASRRREYHSNRQQVCIDIGYMIDAARAVAYLHSFSPGFLHRDIKPANFLVDSEHNVKLTDFGESRSLTTLARNDSFTNRSAKGEEDTDAIPRLSGMIVPSPTVLQVRETAEKMTVKGTVDYMAPELINGKGGFASYGEAADVYSLAMTMWDILNPGEERYPGCSGSHLHVFQAVLDGKRPELSLDLHPTLRDVIFSAWHVDPRLRPSAQIIVGMLENVQEEVCASFLMDCYDEFGSDGVPFLAANDDDKATSGSSSNSGTQAAAAPATVTFSGVEAVEHLRSSRYVDSEGEALRMGRMWLDAGFMHHVRHTRGFAIDDAQFYLDEDYIRLCQPLAGGIEPPGMQFDGNRSIGMRPRLERSTSGRPPAPSVDERSSRRGGTAKSDLAFATRGAMCACRKHGQRQIQDLRPARRPRFQRKKAPSTGSSSVNTSVLTASLLVPDEDAAHSSGAGGGFTDFEWHRTSNFSTLQE